MDRTTILRLKSAHIVDPVKHAVVRAELARHEDLLNTLTPHAGLWSLMDRLRMINSQLWQIEEALRDCESCQDFGPKFVALARAVYQTNDERSATKREIDQLLGSAISEVKSFGRP